MPSLSRQRRRKQQSSSCNDFTACGNLTTGTTINKKRLGA